MKAPKHHGIHPDAMQGLSMTPEEFKNQCGISPIVPLTCYTMVPELSALDNVLGIYAGYILGPRKINILNINPDIVAEYIKREYTPGMKIVFDNSHEGGTGRMFNKLHQIIEKTKIPASAFYYVTSVMNLTELYLDFCRSNNITEHINLYGISTFELSAKYNLSALKEPEICKINRPKTFLCFNRVIRTHRVFLVSLLLKENLVKDSFYSFFPGGTHGSSAPDIDSILHSGYSKFKDNSVTDSMVKAYNENKSIMPLKLNIDPNLNKVGVDSDDYPYFENSLFSLVTETLFFPTVDYFNPNAIDENGIFFSEKIFKPIMMFHPFVLVSRPHSLKHLKKLGYQTFAPFIDESYDDIEDDGDRMLAIVNEVKRLNSLAPHVQREWLMGVLPRTVHNHMMLKLKSEKDMIIDKHIINP